MSLYIQYLIRNLVRKPIRSILTVVAVAAPIGVYVLAMALVRNVEMFLDQAVKEMRLAVVQKSSLINPLPVGHRRRIEALDPTGQHILSVCGMRWFGGRLPGTSTETYFIAADADTFPRTYPEFNLTAEQIHDWTNDRRAAIVGRAPAHQFGWKAGDLISLESTVPPFVEMQLKIVAIPPNALDPETSFMHFDYLNETVKALNMRSDVASFFFVKCASRADVEHYRKAIDVEFAHTPNETRTQDEKSFMESFISAQFDLPNRLKTLSYVVVAVAIMAAANTMMMAFRDRTGEYAVFKALGFQGRAVASLLAIESVLLALIGGLLGAGAPFAAFNWTPLRDYRIPQLGLMQVRESVLVEGLIVSAIIGLFAAAGPTYRVLRLGVVEAFRRLG